MERVQYNDQKWISAIATLHVDMLKEDALTPISHSTTSRALYEEMLRHRLKHATEFVQICLSDEQTLTAYIWAHFDSVMNQVTIESLFVKPQYRNQHLATQLKYNVEAWGRTLGATQIVGTVRTDNYAMQHLNERLGYQTQKVIMSKSLKP
ncbi:GNAT family N-acetyltransferase [Staphylococcus sp. 11261D007BR]